MAAPLHASKPQARDELGADGAGALQCLVKTVQTYPQMSARAALDVRDSEGLTALHMLVKGGHLAGAALLLSAGASANLQSRPTDNEYRSGNWGHKQADGTMEAMQPSDDKSPLHMAIESEAPNPMLVSLLLEHQADPNVRDVQNCTALHLALDWDDDRHGLDLALAEVRCLRPAPTAAAPTRTGCGTLLTPPFTTTTIAVRCCSRRGPTPRSAATISACPARVCMPPSITTSQVRDAAAGRPPALGPAS